jgi:hypothetical protein
MGFAAGLQAGERLGQGILDAYNQSKEQLGIREAKALTPKEVQQRQATPEELSRARAETQAMAAQDAEVFGLTPQEQVSYAPQMPADGQRIGLSRYQMGQQTFNQMPTQTEIDRARQYAMADVIADRDPAAGLRMRRELDLAKRQDEMYPLERQQLEGTIAGQAQQRNLADLQLKGLTRTETELQNASNFATFAAENPDATPAVLKEAAFKQFKFTPDQWKKTVNTRLGIKEDEQKEFVLKIKDKLKGKNLTQLGELYNSDSDFDDKTDLAIVPGKNGAVTLNFIDKTTKAITGTQTFKNDAQAVEYLNKQATEPETIGSWMVNLRKAESIIEAQGAATVASNAAANLSNARAGGLKRDAATQTKLDKIEQEFEALTPDEKVGAKGRALITSYNMASAGPGRQLSLGAAVKPEFTPKDYAITVKSFTDAGFSPTDALIRADQLYGRGPAAANVDANLQDANKKKGLGTATAPIEIRPGESRMTVPGAAVRGPLEDFLRESQRGMFGGVEYFYTDPLTKKRYTTEQYNQLQNQ